MEIIRSKISIKKLEKMASKKFGNLVKTVVDVEKEIMVVDAELHSDQEALLISEGSKQENLWGINLYPGLKGEDFIEFDSMINIRPSTNNISRSVDDSETREKIVKIVEKLVEK